MCEPKPATSVHLLYETPAVHPEKDTQVQFYNEVKVEKSAKCTYFSVIQFSPGGYCGIQERENDRIAIFSLWNSDENKQDVQLVSKHENSGVEPFGGEGTGLKCICLFPWQLNETIGFTVTGKLTDGGWVVQCTAERQGERLELATYRREGEHPMRGMCCFVEDWDRQPSATGLLQCRRAGFRNAHCIVQGKRMPLNRVRYNRVEDGADVHGNDRCTADSDGAWIYLQTGGAEPLDQCCQKGTHFSY